MEFKTSKISNFDSRRKYVPLYTNLKKNKNTKSQTDLENPKTISIWILKSNNTLIRNKCVNNFISKVHLSSNYIFNGSTKPSWVGLPKI